MKQSIARKYERLDLTQIELQWDLVNFSKITKMSKINTTKYFPIADFNINKFPSSFHIPVV
jgi:hypothetical protein